MTPHDESGPSLEFPLSSSNATTLMALSAVMVLVGLFLLAAPEVSVYGRAIGVLAVALFGALGILAARGLRTSAPRAVTLTERAIEWVILDGRTVEVPWEAISRVRRWGEGSNAASLGVAVRDHSAVRGPGWFTAQMTMGFNKRFGGFDLHIPMKSLRGDPDLFADTIQRMLAEPEERATIIDRGIPTPSAG